MKFALAGFLIPYMFVYGPSMVLVGSPFEIILTILTGFLGTMALAAAVQGWLLREATWIERGILFIASLCLIKPGWVTDLIGIGLFVIIASLQYKKFMKR